MPESNAFAREFLELLKRSNFPGDLSLEAALREHHAIITGLNNKLLALLGTKLDQDLLAQGLKGGGGGPHRLDLVLRFTLDAGRETLENTQKLLSEY